MTQETVVKQTRFIMERGWVFQLKPIPSKRAEFIKQSCFEQPLSRMSFIRLNELKACKDKVLLPISISFSSRTTEVFEQSLKAAVVNGRLSSIEIENIRDLLRTIRCKSQDMLQPFIRHLWRQYWHTHGGLKQSLTWAHGPFLLTHLARLKKSQQEEVIDLLVRELPGEAGIIQTALTEWYGGWFWPNLVDLCSMILSRTAMKTILDSQKLEPILKPLETLLFEDGNLPLGLTRERELLILTA
ncbi:hypothetical protein IT408_02870 [Candidatus Uhrbacteria bacterium]|nr:hypothetical protein [Candidatus Uhrbacteria bacterium]